MFNTVTRVVIALGYLAVAVRGVHVARLHVFGRARQVATWSLSSIAFLWFLFYTHLTVEHLVDGGGHIVDEVLSWNAWLSRAIHIPQIGIFFLLLWLISYAERMNGKL